MISNLNKKEKIALKERFLELLVMVRIFGSKKMKISQCFFFFIIKQKLLAQNKKSKTQKFNKKFLNYRFKLFFYNYKPNLKLSITTDMINYAKLPFLKFIDFEKICSNSLQS